MKRLFSVVLIPLLALPALPPAKAAPQYSIQAIRYASADDEVAGLVMGAPKGEKITIAMVVWLIRGGGRNILFDSGYHRDTFLKDFPSTEYLRPDQAVKLAGVQPEEITDIVISHSHWDHLGGIDLFPKATVWIQKEEFRYYTGEAWLPGGNHGGIDPEDVQQLAQTEHRRSAAPSRWRRRRDLSWHSCLHRSAAHLRFAIPACRRQSSLRLGIRQLLSLSQSLRTQSQRYLFGCGSRRQY